MKTETILLNLKKYAPLNAYHKGFYEGVLFILKQQTENEESKNRNNREKESESLKENQEINLSLSSVHNP